MPSARRCGGLASSLVRAAWKPRQWDGGGGRPAWFEWEAGAAQWGRLRCGFVRRGERENAVEPTNDGRAGAGGRDVAMAARWREGWLGARPAVCLQGTSGESGASGGSESSGHTAAEAATWQSWRQQRAWSEGVASALVPSAPGRSAVCSSSYSSSPGGTASGGAATPRGSGAALGRWLTRGMTSLSHASAVEGGRGKGEGGEEADESKAEGKGEEGVVEVRERCGAVLHSHVCQATIAAGRSLISFHVPIIALPPTASPPSLSSSAAITGPNSSAPISPSPPRLHREGVLVRVRGSAVDLAAMGGLFLSERVSWGQEWVDQLRADTWTQAFSFSGSKELPGNGRKEWQDGDEKSGRDSNGNDSGDSFVSDGGGKVGRGSTARAEGAGDGGSDADVIQVLLDASHGTAEVIVEVPLKTHSSQQPVWVIAKVLLNVVDHGPNRLTVLVRLVSNSNVT